jgi:DNA polymerase I-like protein with 3'-5' exonuclease and polymerase domains
VLDFEVDVGDSCYGNARDGRNNLHLACYRIVHRNNSRTVSTLDRVVFGDEFSQGELVEAIKNVDFIVAHRAAYELGWLRRLGVDLHDLLVFDTQLAEYVLLGNLASGDTVSGLSGISTSLDSCSLRRGWGNKDPIVDLYIKHGVKVSEIPNRWVEDRCRLDVETTERLFLDQAKRLANSNRLGVLYTKCLLTPVLVDIEWGGLHLDSQRVQDVYDEYSNRLGELEQQMDSLTGGINWRSPDQVAEYLYDKLKFKELTRYGKPHRTATGKRLADAKTLAKLKAETDEQKAFVALKSEIAKVSSALSKNLEYFKYACDKFGSVIFAEFNQARTATGRLASTGVKTEAGSCQFQNLPRMFKRLFKSGRIGYVIGEADGVQLEFRIAAFLGNDEQALKDISDPDWDAHSVTAAAMYQQPYEDIRRGYKGGDKKYAAMRTAAKSETFKPLYGGSKGTKEQERWYAEFKNRYKGLAKTQEGWVATVLRTKKLITPWGARFYWPRASISNSGYVNVGTNVYNYPIQSLATAEIIPIAIVYLWHRIHAAGLDDQIILVNTVHDSIVAEVAEGAKDSFQSFCNLSFCEDVVSYLLNVYKLKFTVPLGVDVKFGKNWGESDE